MKLHHLIAVVKFVPDSFKIGLLLCLSAFLQQVLATSNCLRYILVLWFLRNSLLIRGEKRGKNLAVRAVLLNFKSQYLFVALPPLMPRISLFYICSCSVEEKHVQNDASLYVLCFKRNNYIF